MGLDMYLEAEYFIWSQEKENIKIEGLDLHGFKPEKIVIQVGYWRKENAIHKWFVENIQDGKDECERTFVSRDQLKQLKEDCKKVLKSSKLIKGTVINGYKFSEEGQKIPIYENGKKVVDSSIAEQKLPTQSGFFFGGTDYGEWYINGLKATVKIIDKTLKLPKNWDFYYHSSW